MTKTRRRCKISVEYCFKAFMRAVGTLHARG